MEKKERKIKMKTNIKSAIIICMTIVAMLLAACNGAAAPVPVTGNSAGSTPIVAAPTVPPTVAPSSTPLPTLPPAPTVAPTSSNPLDVFKKAEDALLGVKTVRLTITEIKAGKTTTTVLESVTYTSFHMSSTTGEEAIMIKDVGIFNKEKGKWVKTTLPATALDKVIVTANPAAFIDKLKLELSQKAVPQIGADVLGGRPMVTYAYTIPTGTVKLWYGVTDGWLYRFAGTTTADKSQGDGTLEYNIPLTIAAPIP
jgi:hypothetical protein